jgi:hypothetical protein
MKFFRAILIRKTCAIFTGLLVLNMSFFLAEVQALKLLRDKQMVENIAKLILGAANEEEKDFAGSSEAGLFSGKDLSLTSATDMDPVSSEMRFKKTHTFNDVEKVLTRSTETISPPPWA